MNAQCQCTRAAVRAYKGCHEILQCQAPQKHVPEGHRGIADVRVVEEYLHIAGAYFGVQHVKIQHCIPVNVRWQDGPLARWPCQQNLRAFGTSIEYL